MERERERERERNRERERERGTHLLARPLSLGLAGRSLRVARARLSLLALGRDVTLEWEKVVERKR